MKTNHPKLQVWSCGGGTQSCAIGALIIQGKLPKPDVCVIADTGRETRTTWEYLDGVLNPALKSVGLEVVRVKAEKWATVDLWSGANKDTAVIPAFSTANNEPSKLPNYCTNEWKVRVVERWLRSQGIKDIIKWIGFSIDEPLRFLRMQKSQPETRFPLVELRMNRRESINVVEAMGWPSPPRSRCWCCPNQGDHEWRELKEQRPDEFVKAVLLEREMRAVDPDAWLHRSCVPLDQVDFSQPEDLFSRACDSGLCFL